MEFKSKFDIDQKVYFYNKEKLNEDFKCKEGHIYFYNLYDSLKNVYFGYVKNIIFNKDYISYEVKVYRVYGGSNESYIIKEEELFSSYEECIKNQVNIYRKDIENIEEIFKKAENTKEND